MTDQDQDRLLRAGVTVLLLVYAALIVWLWDGRGRRQG